MRVEFLPSIDFNQMLVYSTFVHLLFLTWVMFLPDPRTQEQIVVPTFRLDLIELSPKAKPASLPKKKEVSPSATAKKEAVPKAKPIVKKLKRSTLKPKAKQLPPPKPVFKESKARKKILEDLKSFESNSTKRSPLEQLDLLARLVPKAQEEKVISPKVMQEETFRETEREKAAELPVKTEPKAELPVKTEPEIRVPPIADIEITEKERELIALSDQLVKLDLKKEAQPTSALMKELEAIEKKEIHPTDISIDGEQFENSNSLSPFKSIKGESFTSVVEKFQELEGSSQEIKIDVSRGQMVLKEFTTSIQRGGVPVPENETKPETSSALSLYVWEVYKRVYSKWKTPLGVKF